MPIKNKKIKTPSVFEKPSVTFSNLGGFLAQKKALQNIVAYCRDAQPFRRVGVVPPRGLMFVGESGRGKRIFAEALAGETGMRLLRIPSVVIGRNSANPLEKIKNIFRLLDGKQPTLVLFENIDHTVLAEDGDDQAVFLFVQEFLAVQKSAPCFFVATAVRSTSVANAICSPDCLGGRIVSFSRPVLEERREMLAVLMKKNPAIAVDLERLVRLTVGMDYTALRLLIEAAGMHAAVEKSERITEHHVIKAYQDKENGLSIIGHDLAKFDQLVGAYHEAGHAIVAHFHPFGEEIDHISIGEREHASGETVTQTGDFARTFYAELVAEIAISLAGHVTERVMVPNEWRTRQCRSDLFRANELATKMVCWWGLGEGTGVRVYLSDDEKPKTDDPLVERAIKKILVEAEREAEKIIIRHVKKLRLLAQALVRGSGMLGAEEIKKILGPRPKRPATPPLYNL